MKIYEFSPFYNENRLANLKLTEGESWIDEIHICEANMSFRCSPKDYNFSLDHSRAVHHRFDAEKEFRGPLRWGPSRHFPYFRNRDMARNNESTQRNYVHRVIEPEDDDVVILSDLDEILDSTMAEYFVDMVKKHGVFTVKLHHTMFFLNLYSQNWHELWSGAPPDYGYRTFVMSGKYFRSMKTSSDRLRRLGEWGRLNDKIICADEFGGFHHSWLGDANAAIQKMSAYAHSVSDHGTNTRDPITGKLSIDNIRNLVEGRKSLFDGHDLVIRGLDEQPLLKSIMNDLASFQDLILKP